MHLGILKVLSARRSLSLFLAGVVCLACWQVWLTWRLMEQDRHLELERSRQRLEQIADLALAELARSLDDWERALGELKSFPPSPSLITKLPKDSTLVLMTQDSVSTYLRRPLIFLPEVPLPQAHSVHAFDAADELELREQQYDRAIAELQPLSNQPGTRPEALLRTARIERKAGRPEAALETYAGLTSETALNTSGTPYALLAADARCRILMDLGKRDQAKAEAQSLRAGLLEGRWPVRRGAFEYYWNRLDSFGISAGQPPKPALDFATAVSGLYDRWLRGTHLGDSVTTRAQEQDNSLVMSSATTDRLAALVTSPYWLSDTLKLPPNSDDVRWKLLTSDTSAGAGLKVMRSLSEVQLFGRLDFSTLAPISGSVYSRRTLWLVGVALMVVLVLMSGYAVHRGLSQELRVARLQSDFVAAVSHEFRSPLTTLRSLTELLAQNRITDESRRRQSYLFLDRETNRLHRLVEDLLDFGRMESGRKQYRMQQHDAFLLVRAAVAEFSEEATANGFRVETELDSSPAIVQADEEALRRAVRNLLENAMKYSPECRTVWVTGKVNDHRVSISVRDEGMGIDPKEQRAIFQKFVRGNAAKKAGIKGTGIGLSMVRQISQAFGGEIRLQSKVGGGSTFTIVLPLNGE